MCRRILVIGLLAARMSSSRTEQPQVRISENAGQVEDARARELCIESLVSGSIPHMYECLRPDSFTTCSAGQGLLRVLIEQD